MMALLSPRVWLWLSLAAMLVVIGGQRLQVSNARAQTVGVQLELSSLRAAAALAAQHAESDNRLLEHHWLENSQKAEDGKNEQIRVIGDRLAVAVASLRERPERPAASGGVMPAPAADCPAATGAGLYREDGIFLSREAAAAAAVVAERDFYYRRYADLVQPPAAEQGALASAP